MTNVKFTALSHRDITLWFVDLYDCPHHGFFMTLFGRRAGKDIPIGSNWEHKDKHW